MEGEAPESTLRDVIAGEIDKLDTPAESVEPAPPTAPAEPPAATNVDRARDEQGRFVAQDKTPETKAPVQQPQAPAVPPAAPPAAHPTRPSSWKKEYWDHWTKLDPNVANYINQREGEYAKGVSAYKTEFDRVKPLVDAVSRFDGAMRQMGVKPEQFITTLGNAHLTLAQGTPEQKLSMFLRIAQDYGVPVQNLFARGQDGSIHWNPQVQAYQQQPQPQQDVRSQVQEMLLQERAQQELAAFEQQAAEKYPHYEAVKATMAQLLEANVTKTLESAYDAAVKLNPEIFAQVQQAEREAQAKAAAEKARAEAERARRIAVSPRTSTPAVKAGDGKPRSIRESVESAFEQHAAGDRV